jgi:hypothetical protein
MGKKGAKARAKGRSYHSNLATASAVYHTSAYCLGGSRIAQEHVKPGRGAGRSQCGFCARLSSAA